MIEGGGSKTQSKAKKWLYTHPAESDRLLKMISDLCVDFLAAQAEAGAQLLQVFESHAEFLGPREFQRFAWPALRDIAAGVKARLRQKGAEVPMVRAFRISTIY